MWVGQKQENNNANVQEEANVESKKEIWFGSSDRQGSRDREPGSVFGAS